VGMVDTNRGLEATARSMGLQAPFFTTLEALLAARPVDAALVCTPTFAHYAAVRACLERGVHVLVEKPLTESAARSQELAELAARVGAVHAVGYHLAYSPVFERARALLAEGAVGRVTAYRGRLSHAEVLGPKKGWMFDRARAGGGLVRNTASHLIFLLEWLFGVISQPRFDHIQFLVRKAAHLIVYATLSALWFRAQRGPRLGWQARWAWRRSRSRLRRGRRCIRAWSGD